MRTESAYASPIKRTLARLLSIAAALFLTGLLLPATSLAQTVPGNPAASSLIVKLATGLSASDQAAVIARNGGVEKSTVPALRLHVIEVDTNQLDQVLASYRADPQVVRAEANKIRKSDAMPSDPLYPNQWALPKINWDLVFGSAAPSASVVVAVLDTGIDATHPDLSVNVVPGTSILDGSNGLTDPSGHGTRVAGIVAARTNTLLAEGIAGVGYAGVRLMPVTVLNADGLGQDSDVIAGVIWAADHGADVILMAFSNPDFSESLQEAIDYAWTRDIVLVAAVGNDGVNAPSFPAGDRGVIGVSATDANDQLAAFSNYGPSVFLAAPGTDILTTDRGGVYSMSSGTSSSAAIVAGAVAQLWAFDPTLTNGIIVGRLARSADPAGTQEQTGNGRLNLAGAILDTGTEFIMPAGANPVGAGGPFVGPYRAAACTVTGVSVVSQSPAPASAVPGQTISYTNITLSKSSGNCSGNWSINWLAGGAPSGTVTSFSLPTFSGSGTSKTTTLTITTSSTTPIGTRNFTVTAGGSDTGGPVTSPNFTFQLNKAATTTAVARTSGANPSTFGQSLTFNATVSVTAPGSGTPTGTVTFKDGASTLTCEGVGNGTLNGSAQATCTISTLSASGSPHSITATYNGDSSFNASAQSAAVSQTVNKASQAITGFAPASPITYSPSGTFALSATGGASGNPVTFASTTPLVCTVSGNIASVVAAGTCSLTAAQAGNGNYDPAPPVGATVVINKASQAITGFAPASPITYSPSGTFALSATGGASGNPVTFASTTPLVCTVSGNIASVVAAGTCSLTAAQAGNGNYDPAPPVGATVVINKASQAITFGALGNRTYGDAPFTVSAMASSGLAVSFSSQTTGTCAVAGSTVTILAAGPCTIRASQPGDGNFNAATAIDQPFTINKKPASVTPNSASKFYGNNDPAALTGTLSNFVASDGVTAIYSRTTGEATGPYVISATLSPSGVLSNYDITYNTASFYILDVNITGPVGPISKGSPATVTVSFLNSGTQAAPSCTFGWDDSTTTPNITATLVGGNWTCSASRTYAAAGVYEVKVTVTDANTGSTTVSFQYVVIYDASAGFVTGGGWINSPSGAYVGTTLTGKANFGFVSKYKNGQSVPTGETEFQFKAAGFNFHSTVYDWLVIAGAKAQYKGSGTINGSGNYGFMVTVTDGAANGGGGVDKFRIKIWDKATSAIVYDNNLGASDDIDSANPQALGGGSITIHK